MTDVTDPRERYDDLIVTRRREVLDPDRFEWGANSEAAAAGWVVGALVVDEGRTLFVDSPWADGWLGPGGAVQDGESLTEAVVREVREETGVGIAPERPRALTEYTAINRATDETYGFDFVLFEATADSPELADDPGLEDEEIEDARWFDGLPEDLHNPDLIERVYRRCVADGG